MITTQMNAPKKTLAAKSTRFLSKGIAGSANTAKSITSAICNIFIKVDDFLFDQHSTTALLVSLNSSLTFLTSPYSSKPSDLIRFLQLPALFHNW